MRRTGPILRQQKDIYSCWVCRDNKFRETRKTDKLKAMKEEFIRPYDLNSVAKNINRTNKRDITKLRGNNLNPYDTKKCG